LPESRNSSGLSGRTPWSARVTLDPLFRRENEALKTQQRPPWAGATIFAAYFFAVWKALEAGAAAPDPSIRGSHPVEWGGAESQVLPVHVVFAARIFVQLFIGLPAIQVRL